MHHSLCPFDLFVFLWLSRSELERNALAKIIVVVKQVGLAEQQAGEFVNNGFSQLNGFGGSAWRVGAFHGDNRLNSANWHQTLTDYSVLVMTAQILVNVLDQNVARMDQIALLVSMLTLKFVHVPLDSLLTCPQAMWNVLMFFSLTDFLCSGPFLVRASAEKSWGIPKEIWLIARVTAGLFHYWLC